MFYENRFGKLQIVSIDRKLHIFETWKEIWATVCANDCADMRKKFKRDEKEKDASALISIIRISGQIPRSSMRRKRGGHECRWKGGCKWSGCDRRVLQGTLEDGDTLTIGVRMECNASAWGTMDDFTLNRISDWNLCINMHVKTMTRKNPQNSKVYRLRNTLLRIKKQGRNWQKWTKITQSNYKKCTLTHKAR